MRRPRRGWIAALAVVPLTLIAGLRMPVRKQRGADRHADGGPQPPGDSTAETIRLDEDETADLGWDPQGLDAVFDYAATSWGAIP